jgi:hypothetical protein
VFGYTADAEDVDRFERLKANYPELTVRAPLIEQGVLKAACLALVERWGVELPRSYAMHDAARVHNARGSCPTHGHLATTGAKPGAAAWRVPDFRECYAADQGRR